MSVTGVNPQSAIMGTQQRTPHTQLGKDDFLGILAAQLQYQDPLSGGDNTQYVAQLAQFSSLEQMQNLNSSISDMLYFQYIQFGSELVGKNVTLNDGEQLVQGVVEKVKFVNGDINIIVEGKPYKLYQVEEINIAEVEYSKQSEQEVL